MTQYAFLSAYFLSAFIIPLAFVTMLWGMFRVSSASRNERVFWSGLIGILALLPVLTDLRIARGEFVGGVLHDVWVPPATIQFLALWGSRGLTYLLLAFSLVTIFKALSSQHGGTRTGTTLFLAYLAMVVPSFISSALGTNPVFIHFVFFAPMLFALAYIAQPIPDWLWYARQLQRVLFFYISLSALMGVIVPSWTTGTALTIIPGFNFRLHGIFSHSNSLGMAALIYLVLEMAHPGPRSTYRRTAWLLSFVVLVATQSKTAWVGAILAYGTLLAYKLYSCHCANRGNSSGLAIAAGAFVFSGVIGLVFVSSGPGAWLRTLDSETYASLATLTGRTAIWEITVNTWRDNPIFGYGPSLWDMEYRMKYAPAHLKYAAGMAHNQFFQSLGESGIVGVVGLLVYTGSLVYFGVRFFSITRGVSLALVVALLARSISETPFRNQALDLMFFIHFGVFVLFLSLMAYEKKLHDQSRKDGYKDQGEIGKAPCGEIINCGRGRLGRAREREHFGG